MRLIVFSATWCPPCQRYKPVVAAFEDSSGVTVRRIDIDEQPDLKDRYGVQSVPTTVLEDDNGDEIGRVTGVQTVNELHQMVNQ